VARIRDADLAAMAEAGLNRIHIGLESGSDAVLKMVQLQLQVQSLCTKH